MYPLVFLELKVKLLPHIVFETVNDKNYGVVQTQVPHNIVAGDTVFVGL